MFPVLKKLGLSDKEIAVYLALLALGTGSVREIARIAKINRGTTYDILKSLAALGLVSSIAQKSKHHFVAEDPGELLGLIKKKRGELAVMEHELGNHLSELQSLHKRGGEKPVVRYFEGPRGIRELLGQVLLVMEEAHEKLYYVYSSSSIREHYHKAYPAFTKDRIKKKIYVRAISVGPGGSTHGLDERKWLSKKEGAPSYTLIFAGHIAHIARDTGGRMTGVLLENEAMYQSHKMIFEALWNRL